jgi:signal transduction histidine kinase/DNA-binding response OmpR family regulator/streptogramin lyase
LKRLATINRILFFQVLVISFLGIGRLCAQDQPYLANLTKYQVGDGLLHREVNAITEDCHGFIWLATKQGLNRFDGHKFKHWTKEKDNILTNHIGHLLEDANCNLWLIPFSYGGGNFSLLNHHTGEITTFSEKYKDDLTINVDDISRKIVASPKGEILFGSRSDGIMAKVDVKGELHTYELPFGSFQPGVVTRDEIIWGVADKSILVSLDSVGNVLYQGVLEAGAIDLKYFYLGHDDRPYFRGPGNMYYSLNDQGAILPVNPGNYPVAGTMAGKISGIVPFDYSAGQSWVYFQSLSGYKTLDKIVLLDQNTEILFDVQKSFPDLTETGIRCLFVDSEQRTWIGGNFGVSVLDVHPNNFRTYLTNPEDLGPSPNLSCRGIVSDSNFLYVNLESMGMFQLEKSSGSIQKIFPRDFQTGGWFMDLSKGPSGKIWIGNLNEILNWNPKIGLSDELPIHNSSASVTMVWEIFFDENQQMWVGTEKGLWLFEKNTGIFTQFHNNNGFEALNESHILFIDYNDEGNLLICGNKGIFEIDHGKGVVARYWTGGRSGQKLPHDNIQHFYQDEEGVYWLSSAGSGLIRWNKKKGDYRVFDKSQGLSNDVIYAVYPDNYGNLWVSSDYGIIRFNKIDFSSVAFIPADGASHHEFNRISHFQDETGKIYFGSLRGVTEVDPEKFQTEYFVNHQPLIVTDFQQFEGNSDQLENKTLELSERGKIVLNPEDRFFRIEFALLNFMDMDRVNYAYMVEGVDEDWNYQKENYVRLSGLPYGKHKLKIKGQMPNGQWSAEELNIPVWVPKPFYLQWWFLLVAISIIIAMGPVVYFWQTRQLKERQLRLEAIVKERTIQIQQDKQTIEKQAEELRHLDKLKSRFFANVSHELRTPLTLMLGPIGSVLKDEKLALRNKNFLKTAQKNGKNLLNLVNEILDLSKLESGKLSVSEEPVAIRKLLKRLFGQFESFSEQYGVNIKFKYYADKDLQLLLDVNKFEKIFNNLLSNAIKFTREGDQIEVIFEDSQDKIFLKVADTGIGIHPDDLPYIFDRFYQSRQPNAPTQGGTGIGLALSLELARSQEGTLSVESELNRGTIFTLVLPRKTVSAPLELEEIDEQNLDVEAEPAPAEALPLPKEGKKPNLLIVEDNLELRDYIKQMLSVNYQVQTAANGVEAFNLLESQLNADNHGHVHRTDLIISDVMMPMMDGFELLEKLKSNPALSNLPVIMLTARAALQDKLKALRIGVDDYMHKPFEEEELMARVHNLINNYREREKTAFEIPNEDKLVGVSGEDRAWLEELESYTRQNAGKFNLTADMMADEMVLSRTQLFRKIKQLTGLTPSQYVQEVRFSNARILLEDKTYSTVKAVAYEVGFKHVKNFSQQFKKRYGKSPSEYLK